MTVDGCAATGAAPSSIKIVKTKIGNSILERLERSGFMENAGLRFFSMVPVIVEESPLAGIPRRMESVRSLAIAV
jgi:hypothetical protein